MSQISLPPHTEITKRIPINNKATPVEYGSTLRLSNITGDFQVFVAFDDRVTPQFKHQYHYYHQTLDSRPAILEKDSTVRAFALPYNQVIEVYSCGSSLDIAMINDDGIFNRFNHTAISVQVVTGAHDVSLIMSMPAPLTKERYDEIRSQFLPFRKGASIMTPLTPSSPSIGEVSLITNNYAVDFDHYYDVDDDVHHQHNTSNIGYDPDFDDDFASDTETMAKETMKPQMDDDPFASDNETDPSPAPVTTISPANPSHQCPTCRESFTAQQIRPHSQYCHSRYEYCETCGDKFLRALGHVHCEHADCHGAFTTQSYLNAHISSYHRKIVCECLRFHKTEHDTLFPPTHNEETGEVETDVPFQPQPYIFEYMTIAGHKITSCVLRPVQCYYCSAEIPQYQQENHESSCKLQTIHCEYCHKTVQKHCLTVHHIQEHGFNPMKLPIVEEWQAEHLYEDTSAEIQHRVRIPGARNHLNDAFDAELDAGIDLEYILEEKVREYCQQLGINPNDPVQSEIVDGIRAEVMMSLHNDL